jgi:DNA-binding CsgD family transcriptional regulator
LKFHADRNWRKSLVELERVRLAGDELLAAATLGDCWEDGLQQLADAADAGGASIVHAHTGRIEAHLSSTCWAEAEAAMIAGRAPPSRLQLYPEHAYRGGFCVDHDVWTEDEMRCDPYFQEFLRPRGVFYHAKLRLWSDPNQRVTLTLKRRIALGPYEPSDIAILDTIAPRLQAAFGIARRILDAETSGMVSVLHHRGNQLFELDSRGRVLRMHGNDAGDLGIVVRDSRLFARERQAQRSLDRAITMAACEPHRPTLVSVASRRGRRRFLHVVPVTGRARDVFVATAVLVVIIEPGRTQGASFAAAIRQAVGLTEREAQIAMLLVEGLDLPTISERLRLGMGTLRNHLKSLFAKTATRRQGELIALLSKLRR